MASQTSLGRVQPLFKGQYSDSTTYYKLDNVFYEGDTWVCTSSMPIIGIPPSESGVWKKIASKGEIGPQGPSGSFGQPQATASQLASDAEPTVTISASGPDTAKIFSFDFGIPAGPLGFDINDIRAIATNNSGAATASAAIDSSGKLGFNFNIPPAEGEGVAKVDGNGPSGTDRNVVLTAVRYGVDQSSLLSEAQKLTARTNIGAQKAGDYVASPSVKTQGNFLRYEGNDTWSTHEVDVFPLGGRAGQFLQKTNNSTEWASIHQVPNGGTLGAVLTKNSSSDYDLTWTSITSISNSDIDDIVSDE